MAVAVIFDLFEEERLRHERVFRERVNMFYMFTDEDILARYRFPRRAIEEILENIRRDITSPTSRGGHVIPPVVKVLVILRFLAKGDFLTETGDIHGVSKASCSRIASAVCNSICTRLQISYPNTIEAKQERKLCFHRIGGMPNVVGAVDGTLIPIQAPAGPDEAVFVCRKGYHAINVQAVCDTNSKFIDAVIRWPGSTHDSFIMNNCALSHTLEREGDGHLLGDSGYGLKPWLMTPILHPATPQEERYNAAHSRTRNPIIRAFGVLKARFRCLHKTGGCLPYAPTKATKIIEACLNLHNFAVDRQIPAPAAVLDAQPDHQPVAGQRNDNGQAIRRALIAQF